MIVYYFDVNSMVFLSVGRLPRTASSGRVDLLSTRRIKGAEQDARERCVAVLNTGVDPSGGDSSHMWGASGASVVCGVR